MIELYTGTPGSGKSYHSAVDIFYALKYGKNVIANFEINDLPIRNSRLHYKLNKNRKLKNKKKLKGNFVYKDYMNLTVNFLQQYAKENHKIGKENQTLLIIDECSVIFNSRNWDRKDRMEWIVFFQQHRKMGYNVILITQNDRLIDRQIRAFIEYEIKHRLINNYKITGYLIGLLSGSKLIGCAKYWYNVREKIGLDVIRLDKRIADIYNTYTIFEA